MDWNGLSIMTVAKALFARNPLLKMAQGFAPAFLSRGQLAPLEQISKARGVY
jgi:hypothetical protein